MILIRDGRVNFGLEPAQVPVKLVNRVGTALLVGEVLMCDMDNSTFTQQANEGGVFGNGITPAAAGSGGDGGVGFVLGARFWPIMLTTDGSGSAAGTIVSGLAYGVGNARVVSQVIGVATGLINNRGHKINLDLSNAGVATARNVCVNATTTNAGTRYCGLLLAPHSAGVGVEVLSVVFSQVCI